MIPTLLLTGVCGSLPNVKGDKHLTSVRVCVVEAVFERLHRLVMIHEKQRREGRESRAEPGTDGTPAHWT